MNEGLVVEVAELLTLQRFVKRAFINPEGHGAHSRVDHRSRLRGRGMEFADLRPYQAGDDIRHMDWRVTARTGRPHCKVYQEERERPVVFVVDFSPSMYFGTRIAFKSVVAARLAALLAWTVDKQGDRVGALLYSADTHKELTPKLRDAGVLPFLAALSEFSKLDGRGTNGKPPIVLSEELFRLRRVIKPGSIVILISDFNQLDDECSQQLMRLRVHNDIIAYPISDALELAPPKPNRYAITNGFDSMVLDTSRSAVRQSYQAFCDKRREHFQTLFKRFNIPHKEVTAADPLLPVIKETFLRRNGA